MAIHLNTSLKLISAVALAAAFATDANAGEAAKVLLKSGDAVIVHADKTVSPANKGTILAEGDTLETRKGRVQVETIDGAKITFLSQTIFKFNQYVYNDRDDGADLAYTELVKGGLRTVAGQIGSQSAERYQMKTPVGIIQVASGEFSLRYQDTLALTANKGQVNVCNEGGCRQVLAGQSVKVHSEKVLASDSHETIKLTVTPEETKTAWQHDSIAKKANVARLY